jgi:hypothetical protein
MAGDWIKMRKSLPTDPDVVNIAGAIGVGVYEAIGMLHTFWAWADEHSVDGNALSVTQVWIDETLIRKQGFCASLESVGWMRSGDDGLVLPDFDRHNGKSAKKRAQTAIRVSKTRSGSTAKTCNAASVTRKEKKREDIEPKGSKGKPSGFDWSTAPESMRTDPVRDAVERWQAYRRELKIKPWANRTILTNLRKYEAAGAASFVAAVDHSMSMQYQGLFDPNGSGAKQTAAQANQSTNHPYDGDRSFLNPGGIKLSGSGGAA